MHDEYEKIWFWVFIGSRGGVNRMKIMKELLNKPMNINQISYKLGLDYKTVEHHIRVLEENKLVENPIKNKYGSLYFPTNIALLKIKILEKIFKMAGEEI
ncbi:MAG TPA: winged helix-turn-helix domain-containing protein [Geobacterales bacterium]|nr:winged helix-turn-helix domain-containing protein [Geobacterales bacterium]